MDPIIDTTYLTLITGVLVDVEDERPGQVIGVVSNLIGEDLEWTETPDPVSEHIKVVCAQYVASMLNATDTSGAGAGEAVKAEQIGDYRIEYAGPGTTGASINLRALHDDLQSALRAGTPRQYTISTLDKDFTHGGLLCL